MYTFRSGAPVPGKGDYPDPLLCVQLQGPRMLYNALPAYSMQLHVEERAYPRDNCEIVC